MTLSSVGVTQSSVIGLRIVHRNVSLKRFFIYLIFFIIISFCL